MVPAVNGPPPAPTASTGTVSPGDSAQGEAIFEELRDQWAQRIGAAELEGIEDHLTALVGAQPVRFDTPGWIARDVGESA